MSTVPMQQVLSREVTKCITQAANNADQPCQWPSHQIHSIPRGTPPWTADQNRLPDARLYFHRHQSQRGGPPFWGQGTQQQQDGCRQHTRARRWVHPALNNRNRLTTDYHLFTHACRRKKAIDNSRCEVVNVVYVTTRYIVCILLKNTITDCLW